MKKALITGSAGLVGYACARLLCQQGWEVIGIDNNQRAVFFGKEGSTAVSTVKLSDEFQKQFTFYHIDVRQRNAMYRIMRDVRPDFIIHTAGQPAHDLAAQIPYDDFDVNAVGTLNMLVAARDFCPESPFAYTSTSKVYGDNPNRIEFDELETRWEVPQYSKDPFDVVPYNRATWSWDGIKETFPIDHSMHSLFGASKLAADILVQEYGRYFGMPTMCVRPGCITGPGHAGVPLHGFLSYLVKCAVRGEPYTVIGYKGKQVRDNIHAHDLATAFLAWYEHPAKPGSVYNLGGGRESNCSVLEAIIDVGGLLGKRMSYGYEEKTRKGDHIWFIGDDRKWKQDFPHWKRQYDHKKLIEEMVDAECRHTFKA